MFNSYFKIVALIIIVLLMVVGCKNPTPIQPVPDVNEPDEIVQVIEPAEIKEENLYINYAGIDDITTNTAILNFKSNIPCTATIILIAWEREINRYYINDKGISHSIFFADLKPITDYTVVIEAKGSSKDRKVITFITNSPVLIRYIPSTSYGGGGYYYYSSTGSITATFLGCDGSYSGGVWTISAYPNEIKSLILSVNNTTNNNYVLVFSYNAVSYPSGGNGKITLSANGLSIPAHSTLNLTIKALIGSDAPPGIYQFDFLLSY